MDSEDFIAFVCRELNHSDPADGFNTFEVGSVQIEPTQWPKGPGKTAVSPPLENARDAVIRQILERPVLIKKNEERRSNCSQVIKGKNGADVSCHVNPIVSFPVEDRSSVASKLEERKRKLLQQSEKILERPVLTKKNAEQRRSSSCQQVIKDKGADVSGDFNPKVLLPVEDRSFVGSMLEETTRKLRQQYEEIENEKKKRRIQIIEFQKPVEVQTKAKKPPLKKKNKRHPLLRPAATQVVRWACHVSAF